jgi:hypothetical protein
VTEKSADELFNDIISNQFPYNTFSARLNMNLSMGSNSVSSRANIRIIRNNALQVSVQPLLGIEMFRLHIDTDSVVIIDRMNRRYVQESFASLQEIFPIGFDFYTLQSLFTNALFISGQSNIEPRNYRHFTYSLTDDVQYFLSARDRRSGIEYSFTVNANDRITHVHLAQPQAETNLHWRYDNFAVIDSGVFPHRMNISLATASRAATADMTFSNIAVNETFQLTSTIPNGFTRTTVSEIIRIITSVL